ncbi:17337_t:CDS:2, partial [Cetraspora pellucida]
MMVDDISVNPEEHYKPNTTYQFTNNEDLNDSRLANLKDATIYLNQQLNACGYHSPLDFNNNDEKSATKIVECISALLQQQQKDAAYREEMHDQHQKLQSDYELLTFTIKTLKTRAELSEREVDTLRAKLIKMDDQLQSESEKHRSTKDELIKTKANLQNVKSQAMHDIRKRETEYTRFKEKMQKLLNDKYHSTCGPQGVNLPRKQTIKNAHYAAPFISCDVDAPIVSCGFGHIEKNSEKIKQGDGDADAHPELASLKTPESYNYRAAHTQLPFELFAQNLEEEVKDILLALKFEWDNRPVGVIDDFQQKDDEIRQKDDEIRQKDDVILQKCDMVRQKDDLIRQKDEVIRQKDDEIQQRDDVILQKCDMIRQKDDMIRQKDDVIRQKDD